MNVRVALNDAIYLIFDNATGAQIGMAENELNLRLQCQARGWSLVNPPKRRRERKRTQDKETQ